MKKRKEIYVDKVKIEKIRSVLYFLSFFLMFIPGIVILYDCESNSRLELIGWMLIGISGYQLYTKFNLIYSKIRKKTKKEKKLDKKEVNKLVNYFVILLFISHIISILSVIYLSSTEISNLALLLLYFPITTGTTILTIMYGTLLFLWKNDFELKKIVKNL